ncbi:MAG: tRNA (adenosine(37)-N6)-dimethylallyltransferase MiaA [Candidatus Eisenbacteria bacterium]|uniref:tRNA dimethylallyltransferase n=1 Tax=Eiseniibacteriota bacterium TaxID=2212470 RepID=A0A849SI36_UNCEI|nr:tRNA (adenosine(37)-N6)-dimethylallyltransferase MiaA [Candidatus Eisenbacteria bacterium]
MKPLATSLTIAIVGATATGKTAVAERVAELTGGEIVCADSRQVFAELDLGTGKPSIAERSARPHHLFDALTLDGRASAGWYAEASAKARNDVRSRGRVPILVGGSGFYLRAAQEGLADEPPQDAVIRARLRQELATDGAPALHARLAEVDPESAARIHPNDGQRVVRALEVFETSGQPLGWWHRRTAPTPLAERWRVFELVVPPSPLNRRIRLRTASMLEHGLIDEVRGLLGGPHGDALRALQAIGYDEAIDVIEDRISMTQARDRTNLRTRQLAKRQRTWFRHQATSVPLEALEVEADVLAETIVAMSAIDPPRSIDTPPGTA